ncbi:MAG: acyl-CoA synthetase [Alphaproteobacteria bacterium]|nr:acyl-CoA synthetase [Alphaproteobacteria bacterium]
MNNPYEADMEKNAANFTSLSPLSFIKRTAAAYPSKPAVIHGQIKRNWAQTYTRMKQLASALSEKGIGIGDCVAIIAPNIPEMIEAHFGIPMTGGIINALNTRLDASTIAFILEHGEAKILITDTEFSPTIKEALSLLEKKPYVIDIVDSEGPGGERLGEIDYETFISNGDPEFHWSLPEDEWQAIALNYTSGTTGNPKGVVYHHRGAYLNAMGNVFTWGVNSHPNYLWTLPMFHCNGWCFTWGTTLVAGTNICLRNVSAKNIYDALAKHKVTHLCGAPIVAQMVVNAAEEDRQSFSQEVEFMIAAAPPPAATLARMAEQGIRVTHVYGLTEIYGPAIICAWQQEWEKLPLDEQAKLQSRQGVPYEVLEDVMIGDPDTLKQVPKDGTTMGEVFTRGNVTMKGYLKNKKATEDAFSGGWFHTGDLGVWHADNYIELKDRSKDIIISGGENISSIEVEDALYKHASVSLVAVVAKPDEKWGETPCAFIELNAGANTKEEELINHCRENLANYKIPHKIIFGNLPKTSTGKIQKFILREQARKLLT